MPQNHDIWTHSLLPGIAAACGAYIAFMMLLMCLVMYSRQRKTAYVYLAIASFFIMTYEGLNIHSAFSENPLFEPYSSAARSLHLFSFVLLNLAILLMYRRVKRIRCTLPFLAAIMLSVPLLAPVSVETLWPGLYMDLLQWITIYWGFTRVAPRIGQQGKYTAGLLVYSTYAAAKSIQAYTPMKSAFLDTLLPLLPLVFYSIVFFILFRRIVELMQSIYRSSITDGLTGLFNRRHFMKHLHHYTAQDLKISAIFCDIDNFKKLNDTQGHARADEVLKQVASIMEEELEDSGITGRYGGEELVALVVKSGIKASDVAESIRARVESETIVTISVGYSVLRKGVSPDELMKQADKAMYHSKNSGKNRVSDYRSLSGVSTEPLLS